MVDSHCHLADEAFRADLDAVVANAQAAGVRKALVILGAGDGAEKIQAERLRELWDGVRFAVGVHPHSAHVFAGHADRAVDVVRDQLARTPGSCAVGEIGLDYHYDFSPREVQQDILRAQLALAREIRRPVVIHTREADDDTVAILKGEGIGVLRGVFHCFSGGPELAEAALDLGFYLSAAGIVTFAKAAALRETFRQVPLDRVLVETDSPFLAPVPFRGSRNEPARVGRVVETLAGLHGLTPTEMAAQTVANFEALFGA
jgi:TatD DNase family protein